MMPFGWMFADELRRYLRFEGGRGEMSNPLGWWKIHESVFPTIARMAHDYLAIPATSVSVEHTFSKSRHICTDLRRSLKAETVTEALLSKANLLGANESMAKSKSANYIQLPL